MKIRYSIFSIVILLTAFACGGKDELALKKEELAEKKKEATELRLAIESLEKEIAVLDPEFGKANRKSVLITTIQPTQGAFEHFVEVTGAVLSKKNVNISGEVSGSIRELPAIEGMRVSKGQVLARIDSEIIQRNIEEVEKQLELAATVFEKQERLWKQQIGTEIQFLESKNRKETLEKSLAGLRTQQSRSVIRAPFNGTVETVNVRIGELVQPGTPLFQFVGESELYVEADISERYVGIVSKGDSVEITFPSINETFRTKVSAVGGIINPNNRTFKVEVTLPNLSNVKPNMISVVRIKDYENTKAVTVPNYLILQDNKGDYVFTVSNGVANKRYVKRGQTYKEVTEVVDGLTGSEVLVDKGFREVGDNFNVNIAQ
jgi:membrane fusion protein, multidrug efflux system